jgi:hypothetical protein
MGFGRICGPGGVALLALITACSSAPQHNPRDVADANDIGRTLPAANGDERAILRSLPRLPDNVATRFGELLVKAEPIYAAASGRKCRALSWTIGGRSMGRRLACTNGPEWFFVPNVLGAGGGGE